MPCKLHSDCLDCAAHDRAVAAAAEEVHGRRVWQIVIALLEGRKFERASFLHPGALAEFDRALHAHTLPLVEALTKLQSLLGAWAEVLTKPSINPNAEWVAGYNEGVRACLVNVQMAVNPTALLARYAAQSGEPRKGES